jgi:hypothetical protein
MLRPRGNLCTGNLGNCAANPANTASTADHGPMLFAEQLVGEARRRRSARMPRRERLVSSASAAAFVAAAGAAWLVVPDDRSSEPLLAAVLVAAYAIVSRVRFEFGDFWVCPEVLVFVPIVLLLPLPLVPALVAAAALLSLVPDVVRGKWHRDRFIGCLADEWFAMGPVVVLALLAPQEPDLAHAEVYLLAMGAMVAFDFAWVALRNRLLDGLPIRTVIRDFVGVARVDCVLASIALVFSDAAVEQPLALLAIFPLVWMLSFFARDRQARYANALDLQRAYRGTVALLSEVAEFDDPYTAEHSRSIVELAESTAERLGVPEEERQRLEFAALLHDIGKIAIPKDVLNKPSRLSPREFELMKTHTIEGQFMLDRVGGLLAEVGEIVRSCHERWDGGGYPDGLAGEEIPTAARIVFACDAYNAMTTDRAYRSAMSPQAALEELAANAGTQFDPEVVSALAEVVEEGEPMLTATDEIRVLLRQPSLPAGAAG